MKGRRLAAGLKRAACAALSSVMILASPVYSYAMATGAAVTVGAYTIGCVLAAVGVLAGGAAVAVLIGSWDSEESYLSLGASGRLGCYAQMVYNNARSSVAGVAAKYQAIELVMIASVTAQWGSSITGVRALAADLKEFLTSVYGYGTMGQTWYAPVVPDAETWGVTMWSSRDFYPLPSTPAVLVPPMVNNPDFSLFLTSYCTCTWSPEYMNVQNWYYDSTLDIFGVYDVSDRTLKTYERDAANSRYAEYAGYAYSVFVNEAGTFKYSVSSTSYWQRSALLCSPDDAGALPFPVFGSMAAAERYVSTGEVADTYVAGTVPMEVEGFRLDLASLTADILSDTFDLPSSAQAAADHASALADVYMAGTVADVKEAIRAGGLDMEGEVTDVPETGDLTLADILSGIRALPGSIAQAVSDAFSFSAQEAQEQLSVPEIISSKFPFCVPFDAAYLVGILCAEPQAPRFLIPFKVDYEGFHIDEEFVVDLSAFEDAAFLLRVLLDLLFCACLISGTRSLIRG